MSEQIIESRLRLRRPIVFFDLETTGTDTANDRIVEIVAKRFDPGDDGGPVANGEYGARVHPGIPIPAETTEVHGITDDDVKDAPRFEDIAPEVLTFLSDHDLGGFGVINFDIPLLVEEFMRAGIDFDLAGRCIVDAKVIYRERETRRLADALKLYTGQDIENWHTAAADVYAAWNVLLGQLSKYEDLPSSVEEIGKLCRNDGYVDFEGKFVWDYDGDAAFNFGKFKGKKLRDVRITDSGFLSWMLRQSFSSEVKRIVQDALENRYPTRKGDA